MAAPSHSGSGYWDLWVHRQLRQPANGPGRQGFGPKAQGITKTGLRAHICFFLLLRRFLGLWLLATIPRIQFLRLPHLKPGIGPFGCPEAIEKKGIFLAQDPGPRTSGHHPADPPCPFLLPAAPNLFTCCQCHHTFATHFCGLRG